VCDRKRFLDEGMTGFGGPERRFARLPHWSLPAHLTRVLCANGPFGNDARSTKVDRDDYFSGHGESLRHVNTANKQPITAYPLAPHAVRKR